MQERDDSPLPSRQNLDAERHAALAHIEPGNAHAVGYHWGTTVIGHDIDQLTELAAMPLRHLFLLACLAAIPAAWAQDIELRQ